MGPGSTEPTLKSTLSVRALRNDGEETVTEQAGQRFFVTESFIMLISFVRYCTKPMLAPPKHSRDLLLT
jgi:hypothetical protein